MSKRSLGIGQVVDYVERGYEVEAGLGGNLLDGVGMKLDIGDVFGTGTRHGYRALGNVVAEHL